MSRRWHIEAEVEDTAEGRGPEVGDAVGLTLHPLKQYEAFTPYAVGTVTSVRALPPVELPSKLVPHVFEEKGVDHWPSFNQVLQGLGVAIGLLLCAVAIFLIVGMLGGKL